MLDCNHELVRIVDVSREDKALLRSNLSTRLMPEDGQEHMFADMLLPSRSSFGCKAINLLNWCEAPTGAKLTRSSPPVGHMSVFIVRGSDWVFHVTGKATSYYAALLPHSEQ
jgi:hypothetical protein